MVPPKQPQQTTLQQLGPYMGMGIQLAAAMAVFGWLGWLLDGEWDTGPWLMVSGVLLGAIGGMINIIRIGMQSGAPKQGKNSKQGKK